MHPKVPPTFQAACESPFGAFWREGGCGFSLNFVFFVLEGCSKLHTKPSKGGVQQASGAEFV